MDRHECHRADQEGYMSETNLNHDLFVIYSDFFRNGAYYKRRL